MLQNSCNIYTSKLCETKRLKKQDSMISKGENCVNITFCEDDNLEKLEDETIELDSVMVSRLNSATATRLALLKKYLPDEKSVELKNAEGETFKTDSKWTVEFINADPQD